MSKAKDVENSAAEYRPLITDDGETELGDHSVAATTNGRFQKLKPSYFTLVIIIFVESLILFSGGIFSFVNRKPHMGVLYSPANEAIEHQIKVFHVGFNGDLSPWQIPSSPKLDEMWDDLYNFGISWITKDEARRIPNKTHAIPGDPDGHYIAELDVFHNLHCLNMVRKALDPVYYPEWNISGEKTVKEHVDHCLDWIRESIMCHADTSVIVWQWEDWINSSIVKGNVAHTCRNFEKVQAWGKSRMQKKKYDGSIRIDDDIVVPILQTHDL